MKKEQHGHYHVLYGMRGEYPPNVNYFAEDIEMATALVHLETEMDREDGRIVEQITNREWRIRDGDTASILEITDCSDPDCYKTQPLSKPRGWMTPKNFEEMNDTNKGGY